MLSTLGASFVTLGLVLSGCVSSQVPREIWETPAKPISVSQVQREPDSFLDRRVRWGGSIIAARNRERTTEIEVLSRPLDSRGEPLGTEPAEGRFIALFAGFADPAEYPKERLLTISGRIVQVQTRPIGKYPYPYPIVAIEQSYLWPEPAPREAPYYYADPWYHPWYEPWYPWAWPWPLGWRTWYY